jgi:hypothetical protein
MLLFAVSVAVCACHSPDPADAPYVRFASPKAGDRLTGLADIRFETNLDSRVTELSLLVNSEPAGSFDQSLSRLKLDTTKFANGRQTLNVKVLDRSGQAYADRVEVDIDNPKHRLVRAVQNRRAYGRGEEILIDLEYTVGGLAVSADFSAVDSKFDGSRVQVTEPMPGHYQLYYLISPESTADPGLHEVTVTSTASDRIPLESRLTVNFLGAPKFPLTVPTDGAVFTDYAPPITLSPDGPTVSVVQGPRTLVEGTTDKLTVSWSASAENPADRIVVQSPDGSGAWVIPLASPSCSGTVELPVGLSSQAPQLSTRPITVQVSAVGVNGTTAVTASTKVDIVMMSRVGIKFLLNWVGPADLDLAVVTPDGSRIDYDSPAAQGGKLELDSNAMCSYTAVPTEAISWAPGSEVAGQYGIEVSEYDGCGQAKVDYQVLILACGKVEVITGSIDAGKRAGVYVQKLQPYTVDCLQRLSGRILYDNNAPGLGRPEPAVQVPLRILGTGAAVAPATTTDDNGAYDIYFPVVAGAQISIQTESSWTPPGHAKPKAKVVGLSENSVHSSTSTVGALTAAAMHYDLVITDPSIGGAFNILDVIRRAYTWVNTSFSTADASLMTDLLVRWDYGQDTPDPHGSYFECLPALSDCRQRTIWISGNAKIVGPQEFDDSVIAHEFSHFLARRFGIDDTPGGTHHFDSYIAPAFAWSEGFATGIGQQILKSPFYLAGATAAFGFIDLETTLNDLSDGHAFDTDPGHDMTGKLNEHLVAAVLWDLFDPANEPFDAIDDAWWATRSTLTRYLRAPKWQNRAAKGRDLVDFLDGWSCYRAKEQNLLGQAVSDKALTDVLKHQQFDYVAPTTAVRCE